MDDKSANMLLIETLLDGLVGRLKSYAYICNVNGLTFTSQTISADAEALDKALTKLKATR